MATITITTLPVVDEIVREAEERGLSQRAAADQLGVSPQTYNNWKRGIVTPPLNSDTQQRIARFLRCSPRRVVELFSLDLAEEELRPSRSSAALRVYTPPLAVAGA